MRRLALLFIYSIICLNLAKAQVPSRARRFYNLAMLYEAKKQHEDARKKMEAALRLYPSFTDAYSMLGAWYFHDQQYGKAADVFQRAYRNCRNGSTLFAYPLAKSLLHSGRPSEALQIPSPGGKESREWKQLRENAMFARSALLTPWKDTIFNIGRPNTPDPEMFPWITADEQKIYFTRRMNNVDEDFFYSTVDSCGGWFTGRNLGSPPNSLNQEAAQMISADGHYLFFMQCDQRSENGWGQGGCDLYMAYTPDSVWSVPQNFGATINTPGYEGMPCLSPDNRELYFVSDRAGGYGGLDIWMSRFENGRWQAPRNLGPAINTPGNETAPFLHTDNLTLYFSSNGLPGMGGTDFFMAKRLHDSVWSKPVNLGYPINTSGDESSLCINITGNTVYFASDRDSTSGNFDIYQTRLPDRLRPVPVVAVRGFVYDSLTKDRLNYAALYIRQEGHEQPMYQFNSNRGDGSFMITLPAGHRYLLSTDRVSYKDQTDTVDLRAGDTVLNYARNIALLPSDYIAPVNDSLVLTIYFSTNSAKLSDSDRAHITRAMLPWLDRKDGMTVFINGFTDNTGTPLINEQLSYMRAGLVSREISALGIDEMSMRTKGWGEANPVADNETEEGMSRNRRVEVIVRR